MTSLLVSITLGLACAAAPDLTRTLFLATGAAGAAGALACPAGALCCPLDALSGAAGALSDSAGAAAVAFSAAGVESVELSFKCPALCTAKKNKLRLNRGRHSRC